MYYEAYLHIRADFYKEVEYTARKSHICGECDKEILKGEKYRYIAGKWDYNFSDFKMCLNCEYDWQIILEIFEENGEDAVIVLGLLREAVEDACAEGFLNEGHLLVKKWCPTFFAEEDSQFKDDSQPSLF